MIDDDDLAYFHERAASERLLSEKATDARAALMHLNLAERYERLASRMTVKRPVIHIASSLRN